MESIIKSDDLAELQTENLRLISLLEAHGIEWRVAIESLTSPPNLLLKPESPTLTASEKVDLFRRLFRGRSDVYPIRWESKTTGKSGYVPACANEWRAGICFKPKIKCSDCGVRELSPLSDKELDELPPDAPRVLWATGKLVGEGFDHPPLDALVLAMPIS